VETTDNTTPPTAHSRHYRVPAAGWTYISVVCLLGIGSINSQNNLLFFIFGLALGAILVSGIISGSMMMGVRVQRLPINNARAGETARIKYRVHNTNRFVPIFALTITEATLAPKRSKGVMPHAEPDPPLWGLFASRLPPRVPRPHALLAHLNAGDNAELTTAFTPARRGHIELHRIRVTTIFPLGIVEKTVVFNQPATVTVAPRVHQLRASAVDSALATARPAEHASRKRGTGLEFYGLREYTPGDSPRHISWRASARLGTLLTRETESDADRSILINLELPHHTNALNTAHLAQLDPLIPIQSPEEHAIQLAASLAAAATRQGRRTGLRCEAANLELPPSASPKQLDAILNALANLGQNPNPPSPRDQRAARLAAPLTVTASTNAKKTPNTLNPDDLHRLAQTDRAA